MSKRIYFAEREKEDIIARYINGESAQSLAKNYFVGDDLIVQRLRSWGLETRGRVGTRGCKVNHNYFTEIITENQAYWLGMIATDGCISQNMLRFELGANNKNYNLDTNDHDHVKLLRKDLESNHLLYYRTSKRCLLAIRSDQIVSDLNQQGIHPRKSKTVQPAKLSKGLMRHYWRGVIDGDGGVYNYENKIVISLSGSEQMLEAFRTYCLSINNKSPAEVHPSKDLFRFGLEGKHAWPIINHLYENAIRYLPRKYNEFVAMKENWF